MKYKSQKVVTNLFICVTIVLLALTICYKLIYENKINEQFSKSDSKQQFTKKTIQEIELFNIQFSTLPKLKNQSILNDKKLHLAKELLAQPIIINGQEQSCLACHAKKSINTNQIGIYDLFGTKGEYRSIKEYLSKDLIHKDHIDFKQGLSTEMLEKYNDSFIAIYDKRPSLKLLYDLLETWAKSNIPSNSDFDFFLLNQVDRLSEQQLKGYNLFINKGCVSCHHGKALGANMRIPLNASLETQNAIRVPSLRNVHRENLKEKIKQNAKDYLGKYLSKTELSEIESFIISLKSIERVDQ